MIEQTLATFETARDGSLLFVFEPPCPCGRPHPWLYSDSACDAARRRVRVVSDAARDTSRAIAERVQRERAELVDDALGSRSCRQRKRTTRSPRAPD